VNDIKTIEEMASKPYQKANSSFRPMFKEARGVGYTFVVGYKD
tara:strand:+ start:147 stop:275 length:129 start_codon:yes stop_codon:yes gene_type:complete